MTSTLPRLPALVPPPADLPPRAAALRADVRAFLAEERAAGRWTPRADVWLSGWDERFTRELARRGWLGMTIPQEYGGHGASPLDRYVVTEELLAAGAPVAAHWVADRQIGPTLMRFGTEAQRRRFLPGIAAGEVYFGIGMSEPDAGSDLAAVRTRAVQVDGGWELTGTKVWTSGAHRAHAFFALARSAPTRRAGPARRALAVHRRCSTPRVCRSAPSRCSPAPTTSTRWCSTACSCPTTWCSGRSARAGGRSPASWRSSAAGPSGSCRRSRCSRRSSGELAGTKGAEREIGGLVARLWTLRRMSLAVAASLESGEAPELAAAVVKDLGTRYENEVIDVARLLVTIPPDPGAEGGYARLLADAVLHAPGFTLRGGTNEVLRGIVARGMGLR